MAGALVHLGVALLLAVAVHLIHFKLEFSLAVFVGSLLPDVIKFGLSAVKQVTLNVFGVEHDWFYHGLASWTSSLPNWFMVGFFVLAITAFLYHFHIIKKKRMEEYDELYGFLLTGIIVHLILDVFFFESNAWY